MIRIGLLYGGMSSEHDVSLCSAASVYEALDKNKYEVTAVGIDRDGKWYVQENAEVIQDKSFGKILGMKRTGKWFLNHYNENNKLILQNHDNGRRVELDFILPIVHGSNCEDGRLQGLLELACVPYAGANLLGSAVAMDKDAAKRLLKFNKIPVVPWQTVNSSEWKNQKSDIIKKITSEFYYPLFIKPSATGSSIGISKVKKREELDKAVEEAFLYDNKILVEKAVDCFEIECAVLGNDEPEASIIGQVIPKHEFYSYDAKYIDPNGAELKIPAEINSRIAETIRKTAVDAYKALCCGGMARVDFFLEKGTGRFYLNEINTLPGFTSISMYPKLWEKTGISYGKLIDRLIELGFEAHKKRSALRTEP